MRIFLAAIAAFLMLTLAGPASTSSQSAPYVGAETDFVFDVGGLTLPAGTPVAVSMEYQPSDPADAPYYLGVGGYQVRANGRLHVSIDLDTVTNGYNEPGTVHAWASAAGAFYGPPLTLSNGTPAEITVAVP